MRRFSACQVVGITLLAVTLSGCSYGRVSEEEEAVNTEWAEILPDLQHRNDLVPELLEAIKGAASYDPSLAKAVADSRTRLASAKTPAETIAAANEQALALIDLRAAIEHDPQLTANESFSRLRKDLADTEIRIAVGRMQYNARVQLYNRSRRAFPDGLIALLFDSDEHSLFQVPPPPPSSLKHDQDEVVEP